MKIEMTQGPKLVPPGPNASKATEARNRAIQMLAPQAPVASQNNISPEEMSQVMPQSRQNTITETHNAESTEEVAAEAPKAEETPAEPLSSQYAVLARKERAQRQKEQHLRQREADLKAREDAMRAPARAPEVDMSKYISIDDLAKDPFSHLNRAGVSYDQLTNQALNQPSHEELSRQQELRAMKAEIEEMRKAQDGVKKTFEEQQAESYKQAVNQIRYDVRDIVNSDPEFATIKATGSINDVVQLIEETFKQEGRVLSAEEAAIEVESYLVEEALKLSRLEKIQKRLASSSLATKQSQSSQSTAPKSPAPMKTLTNAVSSIGQLSPRERAILAFKGQSNK